MVAQEQTNERNEQTQTRMSINGKDVENEEKEEINASVHQKFPTNCSAMKFSVQFKWVESCAKYLTKKKSFVEHRTK